MNNNIFKTTLLFCAIALTLSTAAYLINYAKQPKPTIQKDETFDGTLFMLIGGLSILWAAFYFATITFK